MEGVPDVKRRTNTCIADHVATHYKGIDADLARALRMTYHAADVKGVLNDKRNYWIQRRQS